MSLPFFILGILTVAGAAAALALRNLVHCVLALVLAFIGLGGLYLQLGAQFIGLAQILIYVGAVAILVVFAILLTRDAESPSRSIVVPSWIANCVVSGVVFGVLAWTTCSGNVSRRAVAPKPDVTVRQIGDALMVRFALPLEVIGLLLTAALIGAVTIAMQERRGRK